MEIEFDILDLSWPISSDKPPYHSIRTIFIKLMYLLGQKWNFYLNLKKRYNYLIVYLLKF